MEWLLLSVTHTDIVCMNARRPPPAVHVQALPRHSDVLVASLLLVTPLGPRLLDDQTEKWGAGVVGNHPCSLACTPRHLLPLSVAWPS